MTDRLVQAHATEQVLLDAIAERWRYRSWYRRHGFTVDWTLRYENDRLLRELVRVARKARALSAAAPDPITVYKAAADAHDPDCDCHAANRPALGQYPSDIDYHDWQARA